MTQTQAELQAEINLLCKNNPSLVESKLKFKLQNLERMKRFYEDKAETAPEAQSVMFKNFVASLIYAAEVLKRHRQLTIKLAELSGPISSAYPPGDLIKKGP